MDMQTQVSASEVARTLGDLDRADPVRGDSLQAPPRWAKWAVLAALVVGLAVFLFARGGSKDPSYQLQEVTRGDLTVTVTATGNLEPRNQVDIGSELSGTMRTVNADFNDEVKAGQVLASLDTTRLKAQVLQSQSALVSAQARVVQSDASLKEARASHARLIKVRELSGGKLPSQQDLDVAESTVAKAEGDLAAAKAAVDQARANLDAVNTDLSKSDIRSPINGVVLVRSVEAGQTVAASLQAPVLFTLAEDLKKMELHVAVDEADVGSVQVGQEASFTVDAYPNRRFAARITQVHFASSNTKSATSSNNQAASATSTGVVTYETVLEVDNSDGLLRPGMTATAEIVTTSLKNVTLVPNAALRFTPEGVDVPGASAGQQQPQRGALSALMPQMGRRGFGGGQQGTNRRMGRAWILENGKPALVVFKPGTSDGRHTQVLELGELPTTGRMAAMANDEAFKKALERKLEPGMQVIVDSEASKK